MSLVFSEVPEVRVIQLFPTGLLLAAPAGNLQVYDDRVVWQRYAEIKVNLTRDGTILTRTVRKTVSGTDFVEWNDLYSDGSTLQTRWRFILGTGVKLTVILVAGNRATYRAILTIGNLVNFDGLMKEFTLNPAAKTLSFKTNDGKPIIINYSDISYPVNVTIDNTQYTITFSVALIAVRGQQFVLDPIVDGGGGGDPNDDAGLRWNGKRLVGWDSDKQNRIFSVLGHSSGNLQFVYSNDNGANFTPSDLGATFAIAGSCSALAYDRANDKFILGWNKTGEAIVRFAQGTLTRSGADITGVSMGSVLAITDSPAGSEIIRDIDLFFLSNGEVGALWTRNNAAGAMKKNNQTRFARIVFGSPPTYKSLNGTASTVDNVGSQESTSDDRSFCNIGQDPYDNKLWALWGHRIPGVSNDTVNYRYSTGSLAGSWAAETSLLSNTNYGLNSMDHTTVIVTGASQTPSLCMAIFLISGGNGYARIYGVTNGTGPTQLDSDQLIDLPNNDSPQHYLAKALTVDRRGLHVDIDVTPSPQRIQFRRWDGSAFSSGTDIEKSPDTNQLSHPVAKTGESDVVEVLFGHKKSGAGWDTLYGRYVFIRNYAFVA